VEYRDAFSSEVVWISCVSYLECCNIEEHKVLGCFVAPNSRSLTRMIKGRFDRCLQHSHHFGLCIEHMEVAVIL
jgi:hypothetical protein